MDNKPDKDIIDCYLAGNQEHAFRLLMQHYQKPLYQLCRRMLGNHADADDALQNTFIKVWKGLPKFRADSKLYSWVYRIASNECLSLISSRKRQATQSLDGTSEHWKSTDLRGPSAEEIQAKLQSAIDLLPEKQRLVFNLKYFEEMKYEEIAAITETSVGALKASYHIAVKKIEVFLSSD